MKAITGIHAVSVERKLSPPNFTTNGLYCIPLPTPLTIEEANSDYRLGVFQPPDERNFIIFYKVSGTDILINTDVK